MLDRAVLAGGVHRLEHAQHRPAVLRVEFLLQRRQVLHTEGQPGISLFPGDQVAGCIGRIIVLQPEALATRHAIPVEKPARLLARQVRRARRVSERVNDFDTPGFGI